MSVRLALALGSNLGDRQAHLATAVRELKATPGLHLTGVSPVYETDPVGIVDQPDYLNAVVIGTTTLSPLDVLLRAHAIEDAQGRRRTLVDGPRTLDIDLLTYDDAVVDTGPVILPHPRAHLRAFVLAPWLDVDPDASIPGRGSVRDLLAGTGRAGVVRRPEVTIS